MTAEMRETLSRHRRHRLNISVPTQDADDEWDSPTFNDPLCQVLKRPGPWKGMILLLQEVYLSHLYSQMNQDVKKDTTSLFTQDQ